MTAKYPSAAVRQLLMDGPGTSDELAAELGIHRRRVQVAIWVLMNQGHAKPCGFIEQDTARGQRRYIKLYRLTPRGMKYTAGLEV